MNFDNWHILYCFGIFEVYSINFDKSKEPILLYENMIKLYYFAALIKNVAQMM